MQGNRLVVGFLRGVLAILISSCTFWMDVPDSTGTTGVTPQAQTAPVEAPAVPEFSLTQIPLPVGYSAHASWIDIYFTDPENPLASQWTGGLDGPLVAAIDNARLAVDVAIYSLSLWSIRDALIHAHERGVQVRVVMESDNTDRSAPQAIREAGIPILGDRREGLMHNKFVIIDRLEVWTGSMNFTPSGVYEDNNSLVRIRSSKVAENFTKEFEEMYVEDMFGSFVVPETPNPKITINDVELEFYFSPDDGVAERIVEILSDAQESIHFMAFSFTSDGIGETMRMQADRGLYLAGVLEDQQVKSNIGTEYDFFKQAGLNVFVDGNPDQMHHKTIIVDGEIVITGSYNFTKSAEIRNDENLIVFHDEQIAEFYLDEFRRVFHDAQ